MGNNVGCGRQVVTLSYTRRGINACNIWFVAFKNLGFYYYYYYYYYIINGWCGCSSSIKKINSVLLIIIIKKH